MKSSAAICFDTTFYATNYIRYVYTCISGAFLPVVYVCDFMSELFYQNKFLITKHQGSRGMLNLITVFSDNIWLYNVHDRALDNTTENDYNKKDATGDTRLFDF